MLEKKNAFRSTFDPRDFGAKTFSVAHVFPLLVCDLADGARAARRGRDGKHRSREHGSRNKVE